ncbi:Uncharacterized protein BM_BM9158 [Brugia malayi]|uniref:Bm9158 n=1 Tax=Brugia malayi TaxID=6279 RepID=A0A0K0JYB1_BRUMA|nr:Uncharacterized protein BM_BM9158 [Brugia malayi]CRZ23326.1 Bm9158 [Brugia malayi]VIO94065.1 Uncharacterized protein BM_BM9158 [Brugia malayi]
MASEVNELMELLNCIIQFETDIKTENNEAENWRQYLINEQEVKKFVKVKQKQHSALRNSEKEVSRLREQIWKAKKDFDYCDKQITEYITAIEAAQYELDELKQEGKDFDKIFTVVEENIMECILKTKIQIYKQTQEDKKRIVAKLELLDCVDSLPCQEDVSAVQTHNDTSTSFAHQSLEI